MLVNFYRGVKFSPWARETGRYWTPFMLKAIGYSCNGWLFNAVIDSSLMLDFIDAHVDDYGLYKIPEGLVDNLSVVIGKVSDWGVKWIKPALYNEMPRELCVTDFDDSLVNYGLDYKEEVNDSFKDLLSAY